ncbi:hypothetical protein BDE36_2515 [Arcticibacter tournemirensis]|uniref:Uncharacterized protein n=1 Tax=Arcticibacter tournemirensis TaxID=699437 RepID=A0A5M9GWR7_9SPHI|nr:hypothetical protein [Arcticibacter tournemirensis]KAA8478221.1 hypothetical protein F1649_17955 [Arcticibacter tournemirensis]TQM50754.1 hypothetical protein BDE36_2515 [Arcticibacter tournemirensis]
MTDPPSNWSVLEAYDDEETGEQGYMFVNAIETHYVIIEYCSVFNYPYGISFTQIKGSATMIGIESGAYTAHVSTKEEAFAEAIKTMEFIDSKLRDLEIPAYLN